MATQNAEGQSTDKERPSWGSAIGLMVVGWIIISLVCGIIVLFGSAAVLGAAGSSTGGLVGLIAAIVIGCMFHSGSVRSFGAGCGYAAVVGLVLGLLVMFLAA